MRREQEGEKMKKRLVLFWGLISILICVSVVAGIFYKLNVQDCGLAKLAHVSDLEGMAVTLDYAWGSRDEDILEMDNDMSETPIIAIIIPTGQVSQSNGSISQEFKVSTIIRGKEYISEEQTSYLYQPFGFVPKDGTIVFMNTLNLMESQEQYIAFLSPSPLNGRMSNSAYIPYSSLFAYVKISREETPSLPTNYRDIQFSDLTKYEFFSTSDKVTEYLNSERKEILNIFLSQ